MARKRSTVMKVMIAMAVLLCCGAAAGVLFMKNTERNLNELAASVVADVDLSRIPDGTYRGDHSVFPVSVEVKVTVKDHKINGIELVKHRTGQGAPAEVILEKVVESQTLNVDIVSGATYSSKVILKAIQNALNSAGSSS